MSLHGSKPKQLHYATHPHNPSLVSIGVTPLINPAMQASLCDVTQLIYNPRNEPRPLLSDSKDSSHHHTVNPEAGYLQHSRQLNYSSPSAIKQKQSSGYNIINFK